MCIYVCVCVYIYMCVCIYIYITDSLCCTAETNTENQLDSKKIN